MLSRLLEDIATFDLVSLEETRVRASNLLCKVFLQHLPVLSQQSSFARLWLRILECMRSFLQLHNSDLLVRRGGGRGEGGGGRGEEGGV